MTGLDVLVRYILPIASCLGVPAIIAGIVIRAFNKQAEKAEEERKKLAESERKKDAELQAIKGGVQAMLRAQMISEFNKALEKQYAPIWAKDNFANVYKHYHSLGVNGVMDDTYEKYMDFPIEKPKTEKGE